MRCKWFLLVLTAWLLLAWPAGAESELPTDPARLAALGQLPVLDIRTDGGALPNDEADILGTLTRYALHNGQITVGSVRIEIKVRGSTSKRFPKQAFRVKAVNADGSKCDVTLVGGLRQDDDWILNPMYTDTSKIRETLAYRLWDMMNSSGQRAASSRIGYAEVFLNGEYWGLYGVQERVDRKQVEGSKRFDVLYKIASNTRPTVQQLLDCQDPEFCAGFELAFAGNRVEKVWEPAAAYMALLTGEENPARASLSLENAIDYGLFAMVAQAHDCHFKNQYLNCVYTTHGYVMYKLPWDLNNTFGDIFQLDRGDINYTNFAVADLVMDSVFQLLVDMDDPAIDKAIQTRWQELRRYVLTHEHLMDCARAIHTPLMQAIDRDSLRWPESGMGTGNAVNIRDLDSYFSEILPKIDAWVAALNDTQGEEHGEDLDRGG